MSFDTDMKVLERYVTAMERQLPEGWHFVTLIMAQDPDDPTQHRIRVHCDRQPTSLPELLHHIANDLAAQDGPMTPVGTH